MPHLARIPLRQTNSASVTRPLLGKSRSEGDFQRKRFEETEATEQGQTLTVDTIGDGAVFGGAVADLVFHCGRIVLPRSCATYGDANTGYRWFRPRGLARMPTSCPMQSLSST
jgi:hypothetical protein